MLKASIEQGSNKSLIIKIFACAIAAVFALTLMTACSDSETDEELATQSESTAEIEDAIAENDTAVNENDVVDDELGLTGAEDPDVDNLNAEEQVQEEEIETGDAVHPDA
ncbi:MAG: hypothetical protein LUB61_06530 [Eggerthellaceae bacterium]|nr:hypothetical protein [Eggerthellaceae bacterium]